MRIGWKTASLAFYLASLRYRALLPILHLRDRGIESRIFSTGAPENLDHIDVLVIVKSFGVDDLFLAALARSRGIPVVLDLCDNIFIEDYGKKRGVSSTKPAIHFEQIAGYAWTVVVTTPPLADIVKARIGDRCQVEVIPDGIETPALVDQMRGLLERAGRAQESGLISRSRQQFTTIKRKAALLRSAELGPFFAHLAWSALRATPGGVRRFLSARRPRAAASQQLSGYTDFMATGERLGPARGRERSIIWFGHHGAGYAQFGMLDLLPIQPHLEAAAAMFDVELVVVSNSLKKFDQHIRPFAMRTRYVEWSSQSLQLELDRAAVAVIPNSLDAFSICKSSNRAVLALLSGVPVVATRTPALEALAPCIVLDDFRGGLELYLGDPARAADDVDRARPLIEALYGPQLIGDRWQKVLEQARPDALNACAPPELAVVIQSPLDWPLLRPVVNEAIQRGRSVVAVVSADMPSGMSAVSAAVLAQGAGIVALTTRAAAEFVFPASIRWLLSASESSLYPHRLAHALTERARTSGIFTATLQHGFECPGLTYHDNFHSARKIHFSSQRIYLWSPVSRLCPEVPAATVERCLVVGCPSGAEPAESVETLRDADAPLVVGIFENLHWHRYSPADRQSFIDGVIAAAKRFPTVQFRLRAHPSGQWLAGDEARPLRSIKNVGVLMPDELPIADDFHERLFAGLTAVISTPSSIVIQASSRALPVAVFTGSLATAPVCYDPLTSLRLPDDWLNFVQTLHSAHLARKLRRKSRAFFDLAIHPGDAAPRIVDDLVAHIGGR